MSIRDNAAIAASIGIGAAAAAGIIVLASLLGIGVGAMVGAIAGFFFPGTIGLIGSMITGGATIPAWQVGAILGFIGAFFKASLTVQNPNA